MDKRPTGKPPGLSIFFPAYNDAGTIASMVLGALDAARALTDDFEVIIVNDGSADSTPKIADELARTYPEVRVVHHPKNRGTAARFAPGSIQRRRTGSSTRTATPSTTRPRSRRCGDGGG